MNKEGKRRSCQIMLWKFLRGFNVYVGEIQCFGIVNPSKC